MNWVGWLHPSVTGQVVVRTIWRAGGGAGGQDRRSLAKQVTEALLSAKGVGGERIFTVDLIGNEGEVEYP